MTQVQALRSTCLRTFSALLTCLLAACGGSSNSGNEAGSGNGGAPATDTPYVAPSLVTLDADYLSYAKQRLVSSNYADSELKPAWDALKTAADKALTATPETVMNKTVAPPSGDLHDYISRGPYWWPNPNTADGKPYIRKDGQTNPDSKDPKYTDASRKDTMVSASFNLGLAYYFTGEAKYAKQAAEVIRTWFLKPETRMNPHLRYGQAIIGVVDGRGTGLIDTIGLWKVIDTVALIAPANELSQSEVTALRKWFADFADWMKNSPTGHEEDVWHNNHGSYYDAQLTAYYLFNGNTDAARRTIYDAQSKRMAAQIATTGKMYMELERTKPFHYSAYNLSALQLLARYGEQVNTSGMPTAANDESCAAFPQLRCKIDMWNTEIDARGLKRATDYLMNTAIQTPIAAWEHKGTEEAAYPLNELVPILLLAERTYKSGAYGTALNTFVNTDSKAKSMVDRLLWPIK